MPFQFQPTFVGQLSIRFGHCVVMNAEVDSQGSDRGQFLPRTEFPGDKLRAKTVGELPRTSATSNHFIFRIVLAARPIALFTASSIPFGEEPTNSIFL